MSFPIATLSCENCRVRKVKCDKANPCSACVVAGIDCIAVQRHRRPRGRTAKSRTSAAPDHTGNSVSKRDLAQRIAQLEVIVEQLRSLNDARASSDVNSVQSEAVSNKSAESHLADSFWTELSYTFSEIKEVLESEADVVPASGRSTPKHDVDQNARVVIDQTTDFLLDTPETMPIFVTPELQDWLLEVYKQRVHTIFRVVHMPSMQDLNERNADSSVSTTLTNDLRALKHAMSFAAVCSLSDDELEQHSRIASHFKHAAERELRLAGLLTTTSLMILQAFVIYLAGLRAHDASAQQWTLLAIAIRIADAQRIPASLGQAPLSLQTELKRRLWVAIGMLDLQSSMDRATQPLLKADDLQVLHSDHYDSPMIPSHVATYFDLSDMLFVLTMHRAGICQRRIAEMSSTISKTSDSIEQATLLQQQEMTIAAFERNVDTMTRDVSGSQSVLQRFTIAVAKESSNTMRLLLRRPLHNANRATSALRKIDRQEKDFDVLATSLKTLEYSQGKRTQHEFARWAWFSWPKWYALAIVLAELCATRIDPEALPRVWDIVEKSFDDYANIVADSKGGRLWKPISKLMYRARIVHNKQQPAVIPGIHNDTHENGPHIIEAQQPHTRSPLSASMKANPNPDIFHNNIYADSLWLDDVVLTDVDMLTDPWDVLLDGLYDPGTVNDCEF